MLKVKTRVRNGRLVVDEATDLPEGAEVHLAVVDAGDDLDDNEREALHQALEEGMAEIDAGKGVDASVVLASLRSR